MRAAIAALLTLSTVALTGAFSVHPVKDVDACIIGSGPGGLASALFLEAHGKSVAIFEKNDRPGGKVFSPNITGDVGTFPQDLGATITSADYPVLLDFASDLGIPIVSPAGPYANDPTTGISAPLAAILGDQAVFDAVPLYGLRLATDPDFIDLFSRFGYGHLSNYTDQLKMPILTWLTINNFEPLIPIFGLLLSNFGYGNMFEIPTMYAVRSVTLNHLIATLEAATLPDSVARGQFPDGFQSLTDAMWNNIQGDKLLNTSPTVLRCPFTWLCLLRSRLFIDNQLSYRCKAVVNAFPPTLDNMKAVYPWLSGHEKKVFKEVTFNKFASGAFKFTPNPVFQIPGEVNLLPVLDCSAGPLNCTYDAPGVSYDVEDNANNNAGAVFTYNDGSNVWGADIYAEDETAWQADVTAFTTALGDPSVTFIPNTYNDWQYFPRLPTDKLELHSDFEDLQGSRRSYYVSGFNNFEATGRVMEFAKQLMAEVAQVI